MIPSAPYQNHSPAELRVFDLLANALPEQGWTAYHSLNLPRHRYKRFGEIDFLLCGAQGIFVLEVKGGGVGCDAHGQWTFTNRHGQVFKRAESPFRQAESALHGFMDGLRSHFSGKQLSRFAIGYAVVLPDCDLEDGAEWDRRTLAAAGDMIGFESWLSRCIDYWRAKHFTTKLPDAAVVEAVKDFIRPCFEAITGLHVQAAQAEARICALTQDQMVLVDVVSANDRVLCSGGAGTGKTFLALELARRWTADGRSVLLACHSPWLKCFLESRFDLPNLIVSTVAALPVTAGRAGVNRFAALIVDEGQDLFTRAAIDTLDRHLENGLDGGTWCVFYDLNNQRELFGPMDSSAFERLLGTGPIKVPLRTNCRNTEVILTWIQENLGADMGVRGAGAGPEVRVVTVADDRTATEQLAEELHRLVIEGRLTLDQVTILSPRPFGESSAARLPEEWLGRITVLDDYALRRFPPDKISFAPIAAFKGLENEAVIVVDLPMPASAPEERTLHYVATSRARAVLSIVYRR